MWLFIFQKKNGKSWSVLLRRSTNLGISDEWKTAKVTHHSNVFTIGGIFHFNEKTFFLHKFELLNQLPRNFLLKPPPSNFTYSIRRIY